MKIILTEQDIINTYDARQQEQCRLYYGYKKIKSENPSFGYKRISKLLGQPYAKTRWWHCGKYTPVPIQTVNWLKEKGFLPLTSDHPKIRFIAKLAGATIGDGGIFGNLNAIFLSSMELESVQEFGRDLEELFGLKEGENARIIEGGEYGHSWCYQNTNRNVIRFFKALGAPIGDKAFIELKIPDWIIVKESVEDEFFGSLLGAEMGIPKVHKLKNRLDLFSLGITGSGKLEQNRIEFLKACAYYLNKRSVKTGTIAINDQGECNRKGEPTKIYRLLLSTKFENVVNFITVTRMNYCIHKKRKLERTMNEFSEIKRERFEKMLDQGYTEEGAMNILRLTPSSLCIIQNHENFTGLYDIERVYDEDLKKNSWYQLLLKSGILDFELV